MDLKGRMCISGVFNPPGLAHPLKGKCMVSVMDLNPSEGLNLTVFTVGWSKANTPHGWFPAAALLPLFIFFLMHKHLFPRVSIIQEWKP